MRPGLNWEARILFIDFAYTYFWWPPHHTKSLFLKKIEHAAPWLRKRPRIRHYLGGAELISGLLFYFAFLVLELRSCKWMSLHARSSDISMGRIGHKPPSYHVFFPDSLLIEFFWNFGNRRNSTWTKRRYSDQNQFGREHTEPSTPTYNLASILGEKC